ncbi:MAG: TolC family protein, partial [Spirochaetales bacterium]|nr:TolC family protein [Spirochaetales bacterium]
NVPAQTDGTEVATTDKENKVLELSLEDAIYRALKNNLGLKSNGFNFDKTKWSLYTCWNTFLPTINGTAGFTINPLDEDKRKGSAAIGAVLTKPEQGWSDLVNYEYTTPQVMPTLGINVSWNFNAAMIFAAYQTCLDYQSGKITYESAKRSLLKNVKLSYYSLILNEMKLDIDKKDLDSKKETYNQTVAQFRSGLVPRLSMLNAQVSYEAAKPTLITSQDSVKNSGNTLKYLLGIDLEQELKLTDSILSVELVLPDVEDIISLFEKNNLQLQTLYISKKMVKNGINQYISSMTPSFALQFSGNTTFTKEAFENDWFANVDDEWKNTASLNLMISVPFSSWIPFSSAQVGLVGSNVALKKMDADIENYLQSQRLSIQQSVDAIASAISSVEITKMSVEIAKEALSLSRDSYRKGGQTLVELNETEKGLLNAQYNALGAQFQYISKMLDLEELLNIDMNEIIKITKEKGENKNEENQ